MRKCVLLLPEIEKQQIWKKKGFENIYDYARQLAGMSQHTVNEALWVLKKIEDKPELLKVVEEKGLNAVRPVASIVNEENASFWAEKASQMSNHTLRTYVKEINKESKRLETWDVPEFQSVKATITMELDPEIADQLNKLKGSGDFNTLMKEFLELRKQKLESTKPEAVEATSRHLPVKIERHVLHKTNGTCAFPGCNKPSEILHHTDRFAMYGVHDPEKIVALCEAHERLAHLGLIENENLEPRFWKIKKHADENDPKYEIDMIVEKFRDPKWLEKKQKVLISML
ncbi:MAG: hypothetical protein AAB373_00250 [Patescibacteria group bacterium]